MATAKTGLLPKLLRAVRERYQQLLAVIDDAFRSENLKDRIWAFEQLIKIAQKEPQAETDERGSKKPVKSSGKALSHVDVAQLSTSELLAEIRRLTQGGPNDV